MADKRHKVNRGGPCEIAPIEHACADSLQRRSSSHAGQQAFDRIVFDVRDHMWVAERTIAVTSYDDTGITFCPFCGVRLPCMIAAWNPDGSLGYVADYDAYLARVKQAEKTQP